MTRILGIESSCDETAIALVTGQGERLAVEKSLIASQAELHARFGGVVPEVAARRHVDVVFPLLESAGIPRDGAGIDAIAVTAGPGLIPALRIGLEAGKALAWLWQKPLVAVNHMEGHLYSTWFSTPTPAFPAAALLVSGGHTEIVLMRDHGEYQLIGSTRDDAAGEAFDKVAKLLGLGYPGGPKISKLAESGDASKVTLPRPMIDSPNHDFSFSGLKTAVAVWMKEHPESKPEDVAASFELAVVDTLVAKTIRAAKTNGAKSVLLSGGVAANKKLRATLAEAVAKELPGVTFHVPEQVLTTDNAAMIAAAGYFRARTKQFADPLALSADPNMKLAA
jgi:N6-L-threonylcarbamoyladenine synthase